MIESAQEARAPLLERILADGLLYRSASQPIVLYDGSQARWMLDSLGVSMSTQGAELAAACLLDKLALFEGRQLATYGTIGIPLMQSCITASKGKYWGLLVRKERKKHGSLKLIEGKIDPLEPVVLLDDAISSGRSIRAGHKALTEAGLHVEGAVCLVRFSYEGVAALEEDLGLHVESVYDVWHDLMPRIPGELNWTGNPTRQLDGLVFGPHAAPERLHPCALARAAMRELLKSGKLLRPPKTLDDAYDARGGVFVSLRLKKDLEQRPARGGFWCFPGEPAGVAARDIIYASALTARELKGAKLDDCAVGLTLCAPLERTTRGGLDNARYGIVVKSLERQWVMGGALPNMPGMANEQQQLHHARFTNGKLYPLEPFEVYRHDVTKIVEPGADWPEWGAPTSETPLTLSPSTSSGHVKSNGSGAARRRGAGYSEYAASRLRPSTDGSTPASPPLTMNGFSVDAFMRAALALVCRRETAVPSLPGRIEQIFLTLYVGGRLRGCVGGRDLKTLADAVWNDTRFADAQGEVAVSVSFLTGSERWGEATPESAAAVLRFGVDALSVQQHERFALLLPHVATTNDLDRRGFIDAVIDKAGITRAPWLWTRSACETWLADEHGVRRMRDGLPEGPPASLSELLPLVRGFAERSHVKRGGINVRYFPVSDTQTFGDFPEWTAHGAWVKARAGLESLAREDLRKLKLNPQASTGTLAFAHLARPTPALRSALLARMDRHGRFDTGDNPAAQDFFPAQALLALGKDAPKRSFSYYRRRFRQNHSWGALPWLSLAFAAIGDDFAFELADFALAAQSQKTGAFLNDYERDAEGALSWVTLEGLSGPLKLARARGDKARTRRYADACLRALTFCDRLVYQERDCAVLPNGGWAQGGVRLNVHASEVRIDFVHHAWSAMLALKGLL
jgi:orotate phosphoribosyltransferase/AMMECR1 domain-containing protein